MSVLDPLLDDPGFVVLDGGLATELEARGVRLHPRLWSAGVLLSEPEQIRRLHRDYLVAGADVVITASYQATLEGFRAEGLSPAEGEGLIRRSVELALAARDEFWGGGAGERRRPLVAASVGPYGAALADGSEYRGDYGLSEAELVEFHRPRWEILSRAGADLLACETIPSRLEARALASLLEATPGVQAWFSFQASDARQLADGSDLAGLVAELEPVERIVAIGVNCTEPRLIPDLIRVIAAHTAKPVVVYPNSGEGWDARARAWTPAAAGHEPGSAVLEWYDLGARLIGGCCRTCPADVRAIREGLEGRGRG